MQTTCPKDACRILLLACADTRVGTGEGKRRRLLQTSLSCLLARSVGDYTVRVDARVSRMLLPPPAQRVGVYSTSTVYVSCEWRRSSDEPRRRLHSCSVFTEGGPPARLLSPIVRMSAEQPRLALADLTKKLPESIARPSLVEGVAWRAWLDSLPPGNGIFSTF